MNHRQTRQTQHTPTPTVQPIITLMHIQKTFLHAANHQKKKAPIGEGRKWMRWMGLARKNRSVNRVNAPVQPGFNTAKLTASPSPLSTPPTSRVLNDISLSLYPGDTLAIMGSSGSGKSTLLSIIGLLCFPSAGNYTLLGDDTASATQTQRALWRNQYLGFVFQSFHLLPFLTVRENVCLPLQYAHIRPHQDDTEQLMQATGIHAWANRKPYQLSGGQQQRVAITRAMIMQPRVLIADEPTGALDSHTGQHILSLLQTLNKIRNTTLVVATHNHTVAQQCDRILHLKDGTLIHTKTKG